MLNYFSKKYLVHNKNKLICRALLKYDYYNFAILIIEYTDIENIYFRETYWITKLLPYYNILKQGNSSLGFKHNDDTKEILRKLRTGNKLSDNTKALISLAVYGINNPFYGKLHNDISKLKMSKSSSTSPLYIYNSFRELILIYPSISSFAKVIACNQPTIKSFIKSQTLFRGNWYFTIELLNLNDKPLIDKDQFNSKEYKELIIDMKNNIHIKKVIFLYIIDLEGKYKFIKKFDGIIIAEKELNIRHEIIKNYAIKLLPYNGYLFSYHRLRLKKNILIIKIIY
jgi:group I intron endonuclease